MDIFFGIMNIVFGILLTLIGFKVYNPFKGKNEIEKENLWYKKFGTFTKIGGILLIFLGVINTLLGMK